MRRYSIRSSDNKEIFIEFESYGDAKRWYEEHRGMILDPGNYYYGARLMGLKPHHTGWVIRLRIYFRAQWRWKPYFGHAPVWHWRHCREISFRWLFWAFHLEQIHDEIPTDVILDYCSDIGKGY